MFSLILEWYCMEYFVVSRFHVCSQAVVIFSYQIGHIVTHNYVVDLFSSLALVGVAVYRLRRPTYSTCVVVLLSSQTELRIMSYKLLLDQRSSLLVLLDRATQVSQTLLLDWCCSLRVIQTELRKCRRRIYLISEVVFWSLQRELQKCRRPFYLICVAVFWSHQSVRSQVTGVRFTGF